MMIQFLGNGGFIGNGLPYNSFMIDRSFLIECPPDIMPSLRSRGINPSDVKRIFLSHFHGDHCFGMPFLILNLFTRSPESCEDLPLLDIIGPKGSRDHIRNLQKIAVSPENPSVARIDRAFNFIEIDHSSRIRLNDREEMVFHRMSHSKETYGFSIVRDDTWEVTYLPDTVWDESFSDIIANRPGYVICDLNGDASDSVQVHMSEEDIIKRAIPVTGDDVTYVGTHLRDNRVSTHKNIVYAEPGTRIETAVPV